MSREMPQYQSDTIDVVEFLKKFPTKEFSRKDIARGSGVPDNHRIGPAICRARAVAAQYGARIESYGRSKDPTRNGEPTLRWMPAGTGDADGDQDANRTSRSAITRLEEARRACEFAATNPHLDMAEEYGDVGNAFGACLGTVSSIQNLHQKLWKKHQETLELSAQLVARGASQAGPTLSIVSDLP